MLGAQVSGFDSKWTVGLSWRYQESDRHFRGSHEETDRTAEHSEVINTVHIPELSVTRRFGPRWSATVGVPFLIATRSSPIRDDAGIVVDRSETSAHGLSDITGVARRRFFDPADGTRGLTLGFGVKIPTGSPSVHDTRVRLVDGEYESSVQTVDQSIQPGDGGFGLIADLFGFHRFAGERAAGYVSAVYLANPENTNGVPTYRSGAGEEIMSVADQYLYRAGVAWLPNDRWTASLGIRYEGVPVRDLIGDSDGFRRPGYAASIEPGFSWSRGPHTVQVQVPWAIHRNRKKSVPDLENPPRHGDAAFADWVLLAGYQHRF